MQQLTLTKPDDWHLHLRDGDALRAVVAHSAAQFARAVVMPNLRPPITNTAMALAYRERIRSALPEGSHFEPLMTLYLTDKTPADEILRARDSNAVFAVKYYPAGATTNSDSGVTDIANCSAALEAMQRLGMPLLVHGEVTDPAVDVFDREAVFIDRTLAPLARNFPALKIVMEHITTLDAVEFVKAAPSNVAATITAHHLLLNRNAIFQGGIQPHHYCLPVLKRETHRLALVAAATSSNTKFFLGTDSAPHARHTKENACGCAGVYTAHAAIELYAEAFDAVGALAQLERFASFSGADFYGMPRNKQQIKLARREWTVPGELAYAGGTLVPLRAGQSVAWTLAAD
ncbi:MAG: dihydroorotase [Betaproteobacteria bacterium]